MLLGGLLKEKNQPPGNGGGETPDQASGGNNVLQFRDRKAEGKANPKGFHAPMAGGLLLKPGGESWETAGIEEKIASLAALGLDEAEIEAWLEESLEANPISNEGFETAVELGRIKGSARIKAAQYEAALQGKVTAQAQVLARLEGGMIEEGEGEDREFEVVQEIITPEKSEEEET